MRIDRISAAGLLSFEEFTLDLDPKITTLVGPNGAGKSNVLQLIDVAVNALQSVELHDHEATATLQAYLDVRHGGRTATQVSVELELAADKQGDLELITAFMRSAIFSALVGSSGDPNPQIASWVMREVTTDRLAPLAKGALVITHSGTEDTRWDVIYRFVVDGRSYDWMLGWVAQPGLIIPSGQALSASRRVEPLAQRLFTDSPPGQPLKPPAAPFSLQALLPTDEAAMQFQAEVRGAPLPDPHRQLLDDVKQLTETNVSGRSYTFAVALLSMLRRGVVRTSDVRVVPIALGRAAANLAGPRGEYDIPRFLVHLKNGSRVERRRYARTCELFSELTHGRKLDVGLRRSPNRQSGDADGEGVPVVRVSVDAEDAADFEVPIESAGSGAWEALVLAAALGQPEGTLVIFDEPAIGLHPTLQRHLVSHMSRGEAQFVVVTHSPYMVPLYPESGPGLLVRVARDGLASRPWVVPTHQLHKIAPKLLAKGNERIPFSDRLVLCEGQDDVAVVRLLAGRGGLEIEARNVAVVDCGGRENLPEYVGLCGILGIRFLAVIDGDTSKARRQEAVRSKVEAVRQAVAAHGGTGCLFEFAEDVEHAFQLAGKGRAKLLEAAARASLDEHDDSAPSQLIKELRRLMI